MDQERFDKGLAARKSVLGAEYVEKSLANASEFAMPFQEMLTEFCW
ncbi:MAG: 4-carboxymuconolactone decarboxylase, partial [Rhizobiales bacterium]|nr:4-carboxymuconolactone decarboxylase [Hyphomicrobiales bacterium]